MIQYLMKISNKFLMHQFLFEELVKRDFKKKYKRTILGIVWSILSPLLMLSVMAVIFSNFFGRGIEHYIIYLFSGQIIFNYFTEATNEGMQALVNNAAIFSKVNVPKYLFLFSKNVSAIINFFIILVLYIFFTIIDGIDLTWKFLLLVYPICCLIFINLGIGLILSALYVFFKDTQYIYRLFTQIVMYGSAIFYSIDMLPHDLQIIFYANPIFVCITYFRSIVLYGAIPDLRLHLLLIVYAAGLFLSGCWVYKKYNYKFLYYI